MRAESRRDAARMYFVERPDLPALLALDSYCLQGTATAIELESRGLRVGYVEAETCARQLVRSERRAALKEQASDGLALDVGLEHPRFFAHADHALGSIGLRQRVRADELCA